MMKTTRILFFFVLSITLSAQSPDQQRGHILYSGGEETTRIQLESGAYVVHTKSATNWSGKTIEDKRALTHLVFDLPDRFFYMRNDSLTISSEDIFTDIPVNQIDPFTYAFNAPTGSYALLVEYVTGSSLVNKYIIRGNFEITTDSVYTYPQSTANRKVVIRPKNEFGDLLAVDSQHRINMDIYLPNQFGYGRDITVDSLQINDFSPGFQFLTSHARLIENPEAVTYNIHFDPLIELYSDTLLTNAEQDFSRQYAHIEFPTVSSDRQVGIYRLESTSGFTTSFSGTRLQLYDISQNAYTISNMANQERHPNVVNSSGFEHTYNGIIIEQALNPLRRYNGNTAIYYGEEPSLHNYLSPPDDTLFFGRAPIYGSGLHQNKLLGDNTLNLLSHFFGPYDEIRRKEDGASHVTITSSLGDTVFSDLLSNFQQLTSLDPSPYTTKIYNDTYRRYGISGAVELTTVSDLGTADANPPVLISFRMTDQNGKIRETLKSNEQLNIQFAAADFFLADTMLTGGFISKHHKYKSVLTDSSRIFVKKSSESVWLEIPLTEIGHETNTKRTIFTQTARFSSVDPKYWFPSGRVYTAQINDLSDWENESMDIRLEILDDSGNSLTHTFLPAVNIESAVGIVNNNQQTLRGFELKQNYPNPFNPSTSIAFHLPATTSLSIEIYSLDGRKVRTLFTGLRESGSHTLSWSGKNDTGSSVGSGIYFYQLKTKSGSLTKKMMLLR